MTDQGYLRQLRTPTLQDPLRVLVSACLIGTRCAVDGGTYGEYPSVLKLMASPLVRLVPFCPEDFSFGTPREMCDCYGGDGHAVLDGRARVLTSTGVDWTAGMIRAAERMVAVARAADTELCVMMDISAACGSQVIYDGNRYAENKSYQIGMGVCAALLTRSGFRVVSQRDFASLELLYQRIDPTHVIDPEARDHDQHPWTLSYFHSDGRRREG